MSRFCTDGRSRTAFPKEEHDRARAPARIAKANPRAENGFDELDRLDQRDRSSTDRLRPGPSSPRVSAPSRPRVARRRGTRRGRRCGSALDRRLARWRPRRRERCRGGQKGGGSHECVRQALGRRGRSGHPQRPDLGGSDDPLARRRRSHRLAGWTCPGGRPRPKGPLVVVHGTMYAVDDGQWVVLGPTQSVDPDSGTTPDEYLLGVREDVGGATLRRVVDGMTGLTTSQLADGSVVYRGLVAAGLIARETGFKEGHAIRVLPVRATSPTAQRLIRPLRSTSPSQLATAWSAPARGELGSRLEVCGRVQRARRDSHAGGAGQRAAAEAPVIRPRAGGAGSIDVTG